MDRITTAIFNRQYKVFMLNTNKDVKPAATLSTSMLDDGKWYEITIKRDLVISVSTYEPPVVDDRLERVVFMCERANKFGLGHVSANEILAVCKDL